MPNYLSRFYDIPPGNEGDLILICVEFIKERSRIILTLKVTEIVGKAGHNDSKTLEIVEFVKVFCDVVKLGE